VDALGRLAADHVLDRRERPDTAPEREARDLPVESGIGRGLAQFGNRLPIVTEPYSSGNSTLQSANSEARLSRVAAPPRPE
jgi:hypothetical protein